MIKYAAPYARMRGLKGKLIGKDYLESILQASSVQTIATMLGSTVYGEQIHDVADLNSIEHGLKQDLALAYMKILTFMRGRSAHFLKVLLGKFELINLKSIIRWFVQGTESKDLVQPFIFSLGRYHLIPVETALDAADLGSFIALMENTPFARPLEIGYQQYVESASPRSLFLLELALDLDYYERLWQSLEDLGPLDKLNASELLGIQYDITNLVWMFRFKEYYDFSHEQIFQYIIPHGWKIHDDVLGQLAEADDVKKAVIDLHIEPYDRLLGSAMQVDSSFILGAELELLRFLHRKCLETFMKFPLQVALLLAFFIWKEMEIRDIITVLSGKHLGLPQERIRDHIITL